MASTEDNSVKEELTKLQGLIETENDSLDLHILDYFSPASEKMVKHIEEKSKYLTRYAKILQELCKEDVAIGLLDGVIDEIRDVTLELRKSLKGSLKDTDPALDPRGHLNYFAKVNNIVLMDLINRLQRIQRLLNSAYMEMVNNHSRI